MSPGATPEPVRPTPAPARETPVGGWRAIFPPAQWLAAYQTKWLANDAIAGVTFVVSLLERVIGDTDITLPRPG